jgi:spermidine synthase
VDGVLGRTTSSYAGNTGSSVSALGVQVQDGAPFSGPPNQKWEMSPPHRSRPTLWAVLLLVAAALAAAVYVVSQKVTRVVFEVQSEFGRVRVLERGDGLRILVTGEGRARQSALYPGHPRHLELPYTRVGMLGLALVPRDARILFVGLGGGAMPMYVRQVLPEARIDVVEIDPVIVQVARTHFGFEPDSNMVVHTGDGRRFIEKAPPGRYDLIVLDAFSDDEVPYALTTRTFLEAVHDALDPDGVVVSNLWSGNPAYASMLATYEAVFPRVHLVKVPRRNQRISVTGSGAAPLDRTDLIARSRELADRVELGFDLPALVEDGYEVPPQTSAPVREDRESASARWRRGRAAEGSRATSRPWVLRSGVAFGGGGLFLPAAPTEIPQA